MNQINLYRLGDGTWYSPLNYFMDWDKWSEMRVIYKIKSTKEFHTEDLMGDIEREITI